MLIRLLCPKCNSNEVFKDGNNIECDNCGYTSYDKKNYKSVFISCGKRKLPKPTLEYYDKFSS